jgi:hypothetical protein
MLLVYSTLDIDLPCLVEVDPYLPFSFKTYPEVLPGVWYFRIGNFSTSLLEIGIDPSSLVIRKVSLVCFDRVIRREELRNYDNLVEFIGLPVTTSTSLSGDRTDELTDFAVCLYDDSFCVDWSGGKPVSTVIRFQSVSFYLAEHELRRIIISGLEQSQVEILKFHMGICDT